MSRWKRETEREREKGKIPGCFVVVCWVSVYPFNAIEEPQNEGIRLTRIAIGSSE